MAAADTPLVPVTFMPPYSSMHGFFLKSNELEEEKILENLTRLPLYTCDSGQNEDVCYYVGVSGLQNENYLSAIATRKNPPKQIRAVIIDINGAACQYLQIVRQELLQTHDEESFCRAMLKCEMPPEMFPAERSTHYSIFKEKNMYWLQTPERFLAVKKMFVENRVAILHLNLADTQIPRLLNKLRGRVSVMYTSNVHEWLQHTPEMLTCFDSNISTLLAPNGYEINSDFAEKPIGGNIPLVLSMGHYKQSRYLQLHSDQPTQSAYFMIANFVFQPSDHKKLDYTKWNDVPIEHKTDWMTEDC